MGHGGSIQKVSTDPRGRSSKPPLSSSGTCDIAKASLTTLAHLSPSTVAAAGRRRQTRAHPPPNKDTAGASGAKSDRSFGPVPPLVLFWSIMSLFDPQIDRGRPRSNDPTATRRFGRPMRRSVCASRGRGLALARPIHFARPCPPLLPIISNHTKPNVRRLARSGEGTAPIAGSPKKLLFCYCMGRPPRGPNFGSGWPRVHVLFWIGPPPPPAAASSHCLPDPRGQ